MNTNPTAPLYLTRFIAAYLVLILHYIPQPIMKAFPLIHLFGEPVNYFFFISGFVMMVSNKKCMNFVNKSIDLDKRYFWIRRVARIYPMYILALFLVVLFHYTVSEVDSAVAEKIWPEAIGVSRWFFPASINFPDWSVSCEFLFYLLFPFALIWIVKKPLLKLSVIVISLFVLNIVFAIVYRQMMPHLLSLNNSSVYKSVVEAIYLHPISKFTIFLSGCFCGWVYLCIPTTVAMIKKYSIMILIASLAGIAFTCQYLGLKNRHVIDAGLLSFFYFPLVLSICSLNGGILKALSWKPFLFLGEISYGIYIMQVPVAFYFKHFFTADRDFISISQFFLYTLTLILVCSVLYYLYEVPAKKIIAGRRLKIPVNAI